MAFWATSESFLQPHFQGVPGQSDEHNKVIAHLQVYGASCSTREDLIFWRDTGIPPLMCEMNSHNAFSTVERLSWLWKVFHGELTFSLWQKRETMWRNFFGCCVSTTIILSSPPWKGRRCFRNNLWFLNTFWRGNSFKAHVITSRFHLYAEKSITDRFPGTGPCSTCLHWLHMLPAAVFSTAQAVSPSSLAGECYTEHAVPQEPLFNKKSVFPGVSVIPDINQCQYTSPETVWACSTFRQSQHTLLLSQNGERGRCFFSSAEFMIICQLKKKDEFHEEARCSCIWPWEVFFPFPFWLCVSYQWLFIPSLSN